MTPRRGAVGPAAASAFALDSRREALRRRHGRRPLGPAGRIAQAFLDSKLTPLLAAAALLMGAFAVLVTAREEEPQIRVPMIDVFVQLPGATAAEVERRLIEPLEQALLEIPGVDHVYSTSQPSGGLLIVRYRVGTDPDLAALRVHAKLGERAFLLPPAASPPLVVPRGIDEVPVLAYTLWSPSASPRLLRQVALELRAELRRDPRVAQVSLLGGGRRAVMVRCDRERLRAHGMTLLGTAQALAAAGVRLPAGDLLTGNQDTAVEVGAVLRSASDVAGVVVGVDAGRPVYLRDVAAVSDGEDDPAEYVWITAGAAGGAKRLPPRLHAPAVTLAVAKQPGTNAVVLVRDLDRLVERLRGPVLPSGVMVTKTRDYGYTADEKSSELMRHLALATLSVVLLVACALGRREAVVVAVAVPVTLALTLAASYLFGYTLNRVTLFALIFAIGILVDDAIVVVENVHRHLQLGWTAPRQATVYATDEVGNPTILATLTVIAALLPLAFVSGLMGPYMRPIPINASAAMLFSLLVAFAVSPWLAYRLFRRHAEEIAERGRRVEDPPAEEEDEAWPAETPAEPWLDRFYGRLLRPLLASPARRWSLLAGVAVLLGLAVALLPLRLAVVKMLPHDNKSELQVVVDMPAGTTLEATAALAGALAARTAAFPEVTDVETYAGTSAPFNFNGLVRHYFLRSGPLAADLQVNLLPKHARSEASHDFARRLRQALQPIAAGAGAALKVAEVPPGPPVLATLVAEVYAPRLEQRVALARQVKAVFAATPGVVDVDWFVEEPGPHLELALDRDKAALAGVSAEAVARTARLAVAGGDAGLVHDERAREEVPIRLRLERTQRSRAEDLLAIGVPGAAGRSFALGELVQPGGAPRERYRYHKDARPVTYVTGEVATTGGAESPVYAILDMRRRLAALRDPAGQPVAVRYTGRPDEPLAPLVQWDGEWQVTVEVFRAMGIAFAVVMVLIYLLVVAWFRSLVTPLIIMAPIPLTLIGILPAHALFGVFFTATSMIGCIALAGIIVRNSILLVDFINRELAAGEPLESAVVRAAAVRFRPIALTGAALVAGGAVILLDPIFQGLAVALISGVLASTALTLLVVPLLYFLYVRRVGVDAVVTPDPADQGAAP